ncbi:caspase family protein [Vibrio parahaemolyticus]|uniref:caspase family protein n=1 Tax=Vibrio TaxID=662 RepID=UPI001B84312F|nr:caspase family protein [Vibrio parahaemolyticus]EGU0149836.1 caspase family protein [Vibrio parahaemolyticus]MCR9766805.1 caspase family protein [Vibrio parahaemolyticus]MDF4306247.1 caspase family protein [Vibrio parahaemolyticus]MDF5672321.1 caspase family protein [Vibrio parahaemolyticus]MDG2732204.1 caspase family protein [Vibrio parahaemolyticus]
MRKALFLGINDYSYINSLAGCNSDAIEMASVLKRHASGSPNFHSKVFTTAENELGKRFIEDSIKDLFSGVSDVALLYFAGHGAFDESLNEGTLIPQDYRSSGDGVRVSDILMWAEQATEIQNKIIILDCCEAGGAGEMRQLRGGSSVISDGITILTACRKNEYAQECSGHGVFTKLLLQALHGGAANLLGNVTPGSLYSFVDNALGPWEQRPVFKTNVSQFVSLKEHPSLVPLETLRTIPEWFPEEEFVYPLRPAYEPEYEDFDPELGKIFAQLQKCNRHSLIEPVDAEHMYFAAINSTGCRLTALGAYYRELAIKGHF